MTTKGAAILHRERERALDERLLGWAREFCLPPAVIRIGHAVEALGEDYYAVSAAVERLVARGQFVPVQSDAGAGWRVKG